MGHTDQAGPQGYQRQAYVDATYGHAAFKADVLGTLVKGFGADVKPGDKAIVIEAGGGRRKSDVIAAVAFRRYYKFNTLSDQAYTEGICFYNSVGERIANYPKQHSVNLTTKHQQTSRWFKPMVRILKNLRTKLVEKKMLQSSGVAPSYYLEGLLYNVPNVQTSQRLVIKLFCGGQGRSRHGWSAHVWEVGVATEVKVGRPSLAGKARGRNTLEEMHGPS